MLVLGRISDDPKAHYEQLKPLLDYVVPRMADVGIREGRILMAKDPQQMASYLRRGRVDWVTETAGTAVLLQQRAGAKPLLLTERDGTSQYHSVFFARRDSGLRSLADLRGHSVAFQRPYVDQRLFRARGRAAATGACRWSCCCRRPTGSIRRRSATCSRAPNSTSPPGCTSAWSMPG